MITRLGALTSAILLFSGIITHQVQAQAPLTASPKFRQVVENVRTQLSQGDLAGTASSLTALSPSSPLEKYMVASLEMELAVKRGDIVAQRRAIAAILESGAAPEVQLGRLNHIAGYLSYQTGAIDNAITYLSRARAVGEADPHVALLLVESYARRRKLNEAARLLEETIEARKRSGQAVPASWYARAASFAFARKDWPALAAASSARLGDPTTSAPDWRSAIVTYVSGAQPEKEAELDLYRLQAAVGALASERDYHAYAKLALEQGYADEAKAVMGSGQASGKLSKTDPVMTSLMRSASPKAANRNASSRVVSAKAGSTSAAARQADSLLASGVFTEATPRYRAALENSVTDRDRLLTRLGIALARSGDLDAAQAAWAQVSGPWSGVAAFWSAWAQGRRSPASRQATAATGS